MVKVSQKVLLVGGGTGGHIVPILEIYKKLTKLNRRLNLFVVGSGAQVEKSFYAGIPHYKIIRAGKLRRHLTSRNILESLSFLLGLIQSFIFLLALRPKVVFAKGGYASLPILIWARILHIPYIIHESDIEMGLSNRLVKNGASTILLGFPSLDSKSKADSKIVFSGPIIREELTKGKQVRPELFGFDNSQPVILITGGSQGSLSINRNTVKIVEKLLDDYFIIHQTGSNDIGWVSAFRQNLLPALQRNYYVTDFLLSKNNKDLMLEAINLADLIIARAGANTIAELAISGKPMVLIPYKHSSNDHQLKNARLMEAKKSAMVITDDDLTPKVLHSMIMDLFSNKGEKLKILSKQAEKVFPKDGLEVVCKEIIKLLYC